MTKRPTSTTSARNLTVISRRMTRAYDQRAQVAALQYGQTPTVPSCPWAILRGPEARRAEWVSGTAEPSAGWTREARERGCSLWDGGRGCGVVPRREPGRGRWPSALEG
jgi:hypothetical protein